MASKQKTVADSKTDDAPSVLVVDPCSLEESVLSTPAYGAITARYRKDGNALLTREENALLLRGDANFDAVFALPASDGWRRWIGPRALGMLAELRKRSFDLVIDLSGDREARFVARLAGAGAFHSIIDDPAIGETYANLPAAERLEAKMAFLGGIGCPSRRRAPVLIPSRGDLRYVLDLLEGTGLSDRSRFLVVAPSPAWLDVLSPETMAETIDRIADEHPELAVIYAGNKAVKDYVDTAVSAARVRPSIFYLTPRHFAAFATMCDLIVGSDGLQSLIATAVGTRMVGIFGGPVDEDDPAGPHPIDAETLVPFLLENLKTAESTDKREPRRRYYESDLFRKNHRDANMFLHTAP